MFPDDQIPLWIKLFVTLFVCVIVPVYWMQYGPRNFLWFSDIALLVVVPALWLESALLASMMILSVGLLEIAWMIDFFVRLITGVSLIGLSSYMFNRKIPSVVRALSLFHLVLPILLLGMVYRLGYASAGANRANVGGVGNFAFVLFTNHAVGKHKLGLWVWEKAAAFHFSTCLCSALDGAIASRNLPADSFRVDGDIVM